MSNSKPLSEQDFQVGELGSERPVLVDFYADWCGPCRTLSPVLEELGREFEGRIDFAKVDIDAEPGLARRYQIRAVPTLLLFRGGEVVERIVGASGKQALRAQLEAKAVA